uniref:Uncharacterized protein n=1 Tax=Anguilla anguilla TaxID=7936 RepID=A0A0E9XJR0_ANGAN
MIVIYSFISTYLKKAKRVCGKKKKTDT